MDNVRLVGDGEWVTLRLAADHIRLASGQTSSHTNLQHHLIHMKRRNVRTIVNRAGRGPKGVKVADIKSLCEEMGWGFTPILVPNHVAGLADDEYDPSLIQERVYKE